MRRETEETRVKGRGEQTGTDRWKKNQENIS